MRYEIPAAVFANPESAVRLTDALGQTLAILTSAGVIESDQPLTWEVIALPAHPPPDARALAADTLAQTDIPLVRVLEDLVGALVNKGAIAMSDLPAAAQNKLAQRQQLRSELA
jgi:hypothetical protein